MQFPNLRKQSCSLTFIAFILPVVLLAGGLWTGRVAARGLALSGARATAPLAPQLDADGRLKRGARGSFDARGYRMLTDASGAPRFVPAQDNLLAAPGDENWDDRFGFTGVGSLDVRAIAVSGNDIYVGGNFTEAGGIEIRRIARWDGRRWQPLGGGIGTQFGSQTVYAIAISGNDVYIGGEFNNAGDLAVKNIAKWNTVTQTWSAVGSGVGPNDRVEALAVSGNDLYAGGRFTTIDGVTVNYIARWNGANWSALAGGVGSGFSYVQSIATSGNNIYVGGRFNVAGGVAANSIARWNGTSWSALGRGVTIGTGTSEQVGVVNAIAVDGQDVYAGGQFEFAGGVLSNSIAKWNGTSWSALGAGTGRFSSYGTVVSLAVSGGSVYLGGDFERVGNSQPRQIARWDGANWTTLGSGANNGLNDTAYVIVPTGRGGVYVGGRFQTTFGDKYPNRITEWNGTEFLAFGKGVNTSILSTVFAVAVGANGDVYVGGQFTNIGGKPANNVARWDGNDWNALGAGADGIVYALATNGDDVFVGGFFQRAGGISANYVARWSRATQTWSALGTGVNDGVLALTVDQGILYAGGAFTAAGGVTASKLARWNGTSWSAFGAAPPDFSTSRVNALAVVGNTVFIGGDFSFVTYKGSSQRVNSIVYWDRARDEFFRLGNDTDFGVRRSDVSGTVNALALGPDGLYVGGRFNRAGSVVVSGIARYNANGWSALAGGVGSSFLDPEVRALAVLGGDLYVSGYFDSADATNARLIARWSTANNAWSTLGSGLFLANNQGRANALAVGGNAVYVGGYFITAGLHPAASFARWNTGPQQQNNPVPVLTRLTPDERQAGSGNFLLTVEGANFVNGARVRWNGADRPTTFYSSTTLGADIPASDLANAGTASINVFNPAPGGGVSNALTFTIRAANNNPVPTITALNPNTAAAGGGAFTLTVSGTNFVNGSSVRWNGANRTTNFVSTTQLTAQITAADIAQAGTAQVSVFNPTPGGGVSNALTFTITGGTGGNTVALTSGVVQTGTIPAPQQAGGGVLGATQYTINVPAQLTAPSAATQLKIDLSGNQDVDLYLRFGTRVEIQNGQVVADHKSESETGNESLTITPASNPPLRAGTYYIAVANFGPGAANFSVTATVTGEQAEPEQEPNESRANANRLNLPSRRTGSARVGDAFEFSYTYSDGTRDGIEDLFVFDLAQASGVELLLTATAAGTAADLDLFLFREENNTLRLVQTSNFDAAATGVTAERIRASLPAGRYFVGVSAYSGGSDYTLAASVPAVAVVSAASFTDESGTAAEEIVAAFGTNLATRVEIANSSPLPTQLAGTTVRVRDSAGVERLAPLFFVAPGQINFLMPAGVALGPATITITSGNGAVTTGSHIIHRVAPGLFTANASGRGVPAAVVVRVRGDGSQVFEPVARFDQASNSFVPVPIDLGPGTDTLVLVLFGTGIRGRSSLDGVKVKIGGTDAQALFAGATPGLFGLDQINVVLPRSLAGRGEVSVTAEIDFRLTNAVTINIK